MFGADPLSFACVFIALYAAHEVGDQWVQTHHQACGKGRPGWSGALLCAAHVATLTATKAAALALVAGVLQLPLTGWAVVAGLAVDAASHYWADRRVTLAALARAVGKAEYYALGAPRAGHDDNVCAGTGSFHLDQAWHKGWLLVAALICCLGVNA
ncbi:transcriptional regulator [Actinomadura rudentiformis]|uniref:Transcriptional regulator n=1 Tax=Actinomadura rudentiformis TaxID=359158 RepID=A0A6H9Z870_9ACTN|nr:transcriptional regulator [Actinomadura rudentiformis]KAB2351608.1 transcriptional regulator [Actinomadura rudentiformis]